MTVPTPPPSRPVTPVVFPHRAPGGGTAYVWSYADEIVDRAAKVVYRVNNPRYGDFTSHNDTAQALAGEGLLIGASADMLIKQLQEAVQRVTEQRDEAHRERDLALAHDTQPYPTAWAYDQACRVMHERGARIEAAIAVCDRYDAGLFPLAHVRAALTGNTREL